MAAGKMTEWRKLPVSLGELCINTTLRCGQSFRWRQSGDNEWSCALQGRILSLRQSPSELQYRSIYPSHAIAPPTPPSSIRTGREFSNTEDDSEELVRHYLNLSHNLTALYDQWSEADPNFKKRAPKFTGIRILRQDSWEALVGFICSSNNNIARISQMVEKLCVHYGPLIGHIEDKPYHDFPEPAALTGAGVEAHLRELGFGYRAKYLHQTAVIVAQQKPAGWLDSLRNPDAPSFKDRLVKQEEEKAVIGDEMPKGGREGYRAAHEALLELQGVGPKVADCVCLMGLGWGEAVPVDTHVWQIAQRDYKFGRGKHSSLTKQTYDAIGDTFRRLWGIEAGWAHSVLFAADLKTFSERVSVVSSTKEVVIKEEKPLGEISLENVVTTKRRTVKRELDDGEGVPAELITTVKQERTVRSVKRAKR